MTACWLAVFSLLPGQPAPTAQEIERARPVTSESETRRWLQNMTYHGYTPEEMSQVLGRPAQELATLKKQWGLASTPPARPKDSPLFVLPYPGGRHPRIGFLDGAIRPQRETKVSVFAPWKEGGYAVADVPEAIWFEPAGQRRLLYLAHTHIPTYWDLQKITLPTLEWTLADDRSLRCERKLPNQVTFGTLVQPQREGVKLTFWIDNQSKEKLTGLNVQMCVMLKGLTGFSGQTNDNKIFAAPFAACHDGSGKRWIVTGWERCARAWGNAPCPCLHADPKLPDCKPGERQQVRGWISFYEGEDIRGEMRRLADRLKN